MEDPKLMTIATELVSCVGAANKSEDSLTLCFSGGEQVTSVIDIECSEVVETRLTLNLEPSKIHVAKEDPLLLDYGPMSAIYGNAPLPDPPRFFYGYYQLVHSEFGITRDPTKYLNWEESLSEWLEFVYSRAYRLLCAPTVIAEACRELLDVQAADYAILPESEGIEGMHILRHGESYVIAKNFAIATD